MRYALFCCTLWLLCGCRTSVEDFSWLEGRWSGDAGDVRIYEEWKRTSTGMAGRGGAVQGTDTLFSERIGILNTARGAKYYALVNDSRDSVFFDYEGRRGDSLVFSNPHHDFPQTIIYLLKKDSLYARIQGRSEGVFRSEEFRYRKETTQ